MGTALINGITVGYDTEGGGPQDGGAVQHQGTARRGRAHTSVPALVMVGRDDEFTPVAVAEFMAQLIPQANLVVIDGAAHLPNLERQAGFNQALHRFLAQRC